MFTSKQPGPEQVMSSVNSYSSHAYRPVNTHTGAAGGGTRATAAEAAPSTASAVVDAVADAAAAVAGTTVTLSGRALRELAGAGTEVASAVGDVISGAYHTAGDVVDAVGDSVLGLEKTITSLAHGAANTLTDASSAVLSSIRSAADDVENTVSHVTSNVEGATSRVLTSDIALGIPAAVALVSAVL